MSLARIVEFCLYIVSGSKTFHAIALLRNIMFRFLKMLPSLSASFFCVVWIDLCNSMLMIGILSEKSVQTSVYFRS